MSAIWTKQGDLLCDPSLIDSHEDLIALHGLRDEGHLGAGGRDWIRVEFTPPDDGSKIADVSLWNLNIDEETMPCWVDRDVIRERCAARVQRMIVNEDKPILVGGPFIIVRGKIDKVVGRIIAVLPNANLVGTDLRKADLRGANLTDVNLRLANLRGANLRWANLEWANLEKADLEGANLEGANLRGANLRWANLTDVNLRRANLRRANLERANLRWANLEWANLEKADLEGADLTGARFLVSNNFLPKGWKLLENNTLIKA
jgi:hypothetical protein